MLAGEGQHLKFGPPTLLAKPGMQSCSGLSKPYSWLLSRLPHFSEVPVLLILKESAKRPGNSRDPFGKTDVPHWPSGD